MSGRTKAQGGTTVALYCYMFVLAIVYSKVPVRANWTRLVPRSSL